MSEAKVADKAGTAAREARIDKILQGAVDPHVHSGPSIAPRAIDHLDLVKQLSEAGFAAVVTKDHDYAGVATAQLITKHHPELRTKIFSGIVLNNVVGGINPSAVDHTAAQELMHFVYADRSNGYQDTYFPIPAQRTLLMEGGTATDAMSGIDRQKVGQVAADMRSLRKPDPYKNKGVRYTGERLKKKVGKTGAK